MTIILFSVFAVLLIMNVPIAFALLISSTAALIYDGIPIYAILQRTVNAADSFILLAIPFFMIAGNIMSTGGISKRMVSFSQSLVGFITGGLAHVNVLTSMLFAGITGAAVADTSAVGSVIIPAMNDEGYSRDFTAAVTASSSVIGVIIPPSIPFVIYGVITGASIGKLFMAGIIPGVLIGLYQMLVSYYFAKKYKYGVTKKFDFKYLISSFKKSILALLTPIIILGGIILGIVTPTEAALLGVIYSLIISVFVFKKISLNNLSKILFDSAKITATVMFMIAGAYLYGWIITNDQIPQKVLYLVTNFTQDPTVVLIMFVFIFFVTGMFIDLGAAIILLVPVLFPVTQALGIDPLLFGVITVISLGIGLITPPVGACLFIACEISKTPLEKGAKATIPFILGFFAIVFLIIFYPEVVLYIPNKLM